MRWGVPTLRAKEDGLHATSEHRKEGGNPVLPRVGGGPPGPGGQGVREGKAEPPLAGPSEDALHGLSLR